MVLNLLLKVDLGKYIKQIGLMDIYMNGIIRNKIGKESFKKQICGSEKFS
jgi:hypothetical protein